MINQKVKDEIIPVIESFNKLGFPRYEALILSILTNIGTATVKKIHEVTDIPLPKVYQTLDILLRKKVIKAHTKTRPIQYTAYSPSIIVRRIQEENREIENTLLSELNRIAISTKPTFIGDISPFNGMDDFKRIGNSIIENTREELLIAMSATTLKNFKEALSKAKERNVKIVSMTLSQIEKMAPESFKLEEYQELGLDHYFIELPVQIKPSIKFLDILKKIGAFIDYIGIIISDVGETLVLLPLFPKESYFGIWIYSKLINERQRTAYKEMFKLAKKA